MMPFSLKDRRHAVDRGFTPLVKEISMTVGSIGSSVNAAAMKESVRMRENVRMKESAPARSDAMKEGPQMKETVRAPQGRTDFYM